MKRLGVGDIKSWVGQTLTPCQVWFLLTYNFFTVNT